MTDTSIQRIDPKQAATIYDSSDAAVILDVRSKVEFDYVGHPPGAIHVAWKEAPGWAVNPDFVDAVRTAIPATGDMPAEQRPVLLICRSGARSMAAAQALKAEGFTELYNVEEGFEGDKDTDQHRGTLNGWRFHGLPWEQT